ncbi:hypothetical protein [Salinarchaeum laminariae]|uniref:hypothetical protein n=1 Tax=Salinarchaeum laminariae TaxID=869888 RepID=UPI0020BD7D0B|nr:hypothetical protein [Salinarchaeum laminariae]
MPEFRVAVDSETADALQTETDLLGFRDSESYLSWIVDNRAAIEQGTESAELLDSYRDRLVALEERLAAEGVDPADVETGTDPLSNATPANAGAADPTPGTTTTSERPTTSEQSTFDGSNATSNNATSAAANVNATSTHRKSSSAATTSTSAKTQASANGSEETERAASNLTRTTNSRSDVDRIETSADRSPSIETGGSSSSPSATGHSDGATEDSSADEPRAASDGGVRAEAEITSMHLQPERVQRVREDPVTEDAGSLKDVEMDRLDEMSRRAVAQTRKQLDREVETGLDYSSATTLQNSDVRPGEDLADLDRLDVPGRTEGLVEARRVVVGRALAYLHDAGRARKRDFIAELFEDWPAGYESTAGWWRCVRESLKQVDAVTAGQVWTYDA